MRRRERRKGSEWRLQTLLKGVVGGVFADREGGEPLVELYAEGQAEEEGEEGGEEEEHGGGLARGEPLEGRALHLFFGLREFRISAVRDSASCVNVF